MCKIDREGGAGCACIPFVPTTTCLLTPDTLPTYTQGFVDKVSPGLVGLQAPPRKRRFLVLTNTALRWYKRTEGDELFGDHVRFFLFLSSLGGWGVYN